MTTTSRSTELEAVNQMLSGIGEPPIQSLVDEANEDSLIAQQILDEVCRELATRDWWFNRETEVKFSPDADGHIEIPGDIATLESHYDYGSLRANYTIKSDRLYDLDAKTDVFTQDVYLDVVYLRAWEDLPVPAQVYVAARATRKLAARLEKHGPTVQITDQDEREAEIRLKQADVRVQTPRMIHRGELDGYGWGRQKRHWGGLYR